MNYKNDITIEGDIAHICLPCERVALVDTDQVPLIGQYRWTSKKSSPRAYVITTQVPEGYSATEMKLHRLVMDVGVGYSLMTRTGDRRIVDHQSGDGLDNRRENLIVCTDRENPKNQRRQSDNTSGDKGVSATDGGRWKVSIASDGVLPGLGMFSAPLEAAQAYDYSAHHLHGEHARTNM